MAITATHLTGSADTSNVASYATASITPTANRLVIAAVFTSKGTATVGTPTLSGNGLTWVQIATAINSTSVRRVTLFRAMGASPSAGVLTADYGGVNQSGTGIHVAEFAGIDTGGTNGSAAVVQSNTGNDASASTLVITLAAFGNANNATYGAFLSSGAAPVTPGSGFSELLENAFATPTVTMESEWLATNDTSVDVTFNGVGDITGAAIEIKAASSVQNVTPAVLGGTSQGAITFGLGAVAVTPAALGPATFPAPVVARGAVSVTPALLGSAAIVAPTFSFGAISAGPFAALGGATVAALVVAPGAVAVAPAVLGGGATLGDIKLNLAFGVAALGTASTATPVLINRQLVQPTAVLGTATLGSPQLNLSLPIPAIGPASVAAPVLVAGAAAISPAALGTATLPALVVAPGAVSITPAALGPASVIAPQLNLGIAPAAIGPATLPALVVAPGAVVITPAVLGTASNPAFILTVPQTIGPFALLGGATVADPALPVVINATSAGTFASTLNQASYATVSWTPTDDVLVLVAVANNDSADAAIPTLSGNSLTWDQVATVLSPDTSSRCSVFRAWSGASPSTGALTADFGGSSQTGCSIHISEWTGTSGAAANGGLAIAQSATGAGTAANPSITLGTFGQAANATYGAFRGGANPAAGSGFTALAETTYTGPTTFLITEWNPGNDTTVDTTTASSGYQAVALEIQNIIVPGAIGPMDALGPASLASPALVQSVTPDVIGGATVPAPQLTLVSLLDALGGATVPEPTLLPGVVSVVIDDLLGGASLFEPLVAEGQFLVGPFDLLGGGASVAEPIVFAFSLVETLGGATLAEFNVELRFYPEVLGGASAATPVEILAAPPPFDIPALGEAQLPNISLVMLVDVEALGGATLGVPLMGSYVQPDALGMASLPDLIVAAGAVIIEADPLGGASVAAPDALHQSVGAFDALGGASVADPSVSQAIAVDALGGAVLTDPQLLQLVAVSILGGADAPDPSLYATNVIEADALGPALLADIALTSTSEMALLGGAQVFDPEILVAVVLIEPDVLGLASLGDLQLNQAVVVDALGGASVPDMVVAVAGIPVLPASLGPASVAQPTLIVGAISVELDALGLATVATPGVLMYVVIPVLGGASTGVPSLAYNMAPDALGGATTPAPTLVAGTIQTGPFARLGGSLLKDMVVFTGYEFGPPPAIVGGRATRPSLSGDGHRPRLSTRKRTPELV